MTYRIRELREARGWSQAELAEHAGFRGRASSISDLETGKQTNPQIGRLEAIAAALGVHVFDLFGPEEGRDPTTAEIVRILGTMSDSDRTALLRILRRREP